MLKAVDYGKFACMSLGRKRWRLGGRAENLSNAPAPVPRRGRRLRIFLDCLCWIYAIFAVAVWLVMRFEGDRWWIATLVLFGPRWVVALPLGILIPVAVVWQRRSLWPLMVASFIVAFPLMDLEVPWRRLAPTRGGGPMLRVLTCNTHGVQLDNAAFTRLLAETHPDIVALQEWYPPNGPAIFGDGHWFIINEGELCLASRYRIRRVESIGGHRWGWAGAAIQYEVEAPSGAFSFINLHLESPHVAFLATLRRSSSASAQVMRNIQQRMRQAEEMRRVAEKLGDSVMLAGDFNTPADSPIYRQSLSGFANAFSKSGFGFGWSYYAQGTVTRIDHILTGSAWQCRDCWVSPPVGSPHRAVIADFLWVGAQ